MTEHNPICISSGHGKHIRGAAGPAPWGLDEVNEARKVVNRVADILEAGGVTVHVFHDDTSTSQNENLNRIVNYHNSKQRSLDVSVHFNAYNVTSNPMGHECLFVTQEKLAMQVASAASAAGHFLNRGAKYRADLFFLNNTNKPAILIETCFCDSHADADLYRDHFEAICESIAESIAGKKLDTAPPPDRPPVEVPTPPERPPAGVARATLGKGDTGDDVVYLQKVLGVLKADGDFGGITDTWVRAFQSACGVAADGIVGPITWDHVDALQARVDNEPKPLPKPLADQIYEMAMASEIADYSWRDRGMPPPGYIAGMAQAFGYAVTLWKLGDQATTVMARAAGNPSTDALAYLSQEFSNAGMSNREAGLATLRHLFVLSTGLGMRESSGKYCEGRDMSADNVQSETAESGLTQTSWNIKAANPTIAPMLNEFWINPNGFLATFKDGINPTADNLNSYGSGDGVKYQWLSRFCPLMHILTTAVGLRTLRAHWGPVGRHEVEIRREMDSLLQAVQDLVEASESVA